MQIKGKLSIKGGETKISHFSSPKESSYGWERRREKGIREKKKKKRRGEEEEKRRRRAKKVWNSKVWYGFP